MNSCPHAKAYTVYPTIGPAGSQATGAASHVTVTVSSALFVVDVTVGRPGASPGAHASAAVTTASRSLITLLEATDCAAADAASRNALLLTGTGAVYPTVIIAVAEVAASTVSAMLTVSSATFPSLSVDANIGATAASASRERSTSVSKPRTTASGADVGVSGSLNVTVQVACALSGLEQLEAAPVPRSERRSPVESFGNAATNALALSLSTTSTVICAPAGTSAGPVFEMR
ncbi:unannotated protein [freshwater metagenome]|uniref:Unannotated protein n=1 Tax=freshwater metagenome TaxID=449393 RepID=A0A6J5YIK0_9ZZZZ